MKTKQYFFASANTGSGFVNYLNKITQSQGFTYIIKGGSGTGKSTMMRQIADYFYNKGYSIELFCCSSDPESLDGVRIKDKNIAIIDGTAPHNVDCFLAGVTHKIIDIGAFVKNDIKKYEDKLLSLYEKKAKHFSVFYHYLQSAKILDNINFENIKQTIKHDMIEKSAKNVFSKIRNIKNLEQDSRTLFLDSINHEATTLEYKNKFKKVSVLANRYEMFLVVDRLKMMLESNQIPFISIQDVLDPDKTKSLLIGGKYIIKNIKNLRDSNKKISNNNKTIKKILHFAKIEAGEAKVQHKKIEEIYKKFVDFEGVQNLCREVIKEIEIR